MKKSTKQIVLIGLIVLLLLAGVLYASLDRRGEAASVPRAEETKPTPAAAAPGAQNAGETPKPSAEAIDYGKTENWAYFELGEDRDVDVFLICPTVDTRSETNSFDLNDKLKGIFVNALDMEKGIFEESGRLFSPYYRQMSINAYLLPEAERIQARQIAYTDVSAAFRWYLENENNGRGIILAGFSQGGEMCLELLKEYYGGEGTEAKALRERLIAVYSIGWVVTEDMTAEYPQIVPAAGETDVGSVICFDCEDGNVTETIIIPAGVKALSINPLNWKTDGTPADRSLNRGAVLQTGAEPIPMLCGAYIGPRGELIVTDVTPTDYPPGLDVFPVGSYHLYDYMFFFENLRENVAVRTAAWSDARGETKPSDVKLSDDSSGFVLLSEAVPDVILEIRYYSTYNFVGERIDGYQEPLAFLTKEAASALKEVSDELMGMGYRLKIFDAYRPQMAVTHFMNWALDVDDTRMKEYFYPELDKSVLFPQGYIAEHSGHSRGSTVDLTLFDMHTEREVDMGGTFDYFGELSHPDYKEITEEQYAMRMLLRNVMVKHGFRPLPEEWWHFTLENEPYPDTYFTFPINSDSLDRAA
jgi:D-alanyl-D-alanine dipeptidase